MSTTNKLIACLSFWLITGFCFAQAVSERASEREPERGTRAFMSAQAADAPAGEGTTPQEGSIHVGRNDEYNTYTPEELLKKIFVKKGIINNVQVSVAKWNNQTKKWEDTTNGQINRNTGRGFAYFDARHLSRDILPTEEGLILSTGNTFIAEGPNKLQNSLPGLNGNVLVGTSNPADPDLLRIAKEKAKNPGSISIKDQTSLIFDFTATTGEVEFKYFFASEEYPGYVDSDFNDAFGFFVWEVDAAGNAIGEKKNIAILPELSSDGKEIPVSINSVNFGKADYTNIEYNSLCYPTPVGHFDKYQNYKYFQPIPISNYLKPNQCSTSDPRATDLMKSMELNGRTKELVARATLQPCHTYRMKLIIGNVNDNAYGSAVFLAANSFDLGEPIQNIIPLVGNGTAVSNKVYKGHQGTFNFDKGFVSPQEKKLEFKLEGTLQAQQNITTSTGTPMPASQWLTFPAGKRTSTLKYTITHQAKDGDNVKATFIGEGNCEYTRSTMTLTVLDPETSIVTATPTPTILCSNTTKDGRIDVTVTNGVGFYKYRLLQKVKSGNTETETVVADWQDDNYFENLGGGNYIVEVKDLAYTSIPEGGTNIKRVSVKIYDPSSLVNTSPLVMEDCSGVFEINGANALTSGTGRWSVDAGTPVANVTFDNAQSAKTVVRLAKKVTEARVFWTTRIPTCNIEVKLPLITLRRAGTADLTAYKNIYKTVSRSALTTVLDLSEELEADVKADSKWKNSVGVAKGVTISADGKVNASALKKDGTYIFQFESDVPCAGIVTRYFYLTITK